MKFRRLPLELKAILVACFLGLLLLLVAIISDFALGRMESDYEGVIERDVRSLVVMRSIVRNSSELRRLVAESMLSPEAVRAQRLERLRGSWSLNDQNFETLSDIWRGTALEPQMKLVELARQRYRDAASRYLDPFSTDVGAAAIDDHFALEALYADYLTHQDNITAIIAAGMS